MKYLGFFVERMQGNEVVGRITPVRGLRKGNGTGYDPAPAASFPKSIRLVEERETARPPGAAAVVAAKARVLELVVPVGFAKASVQLWTGRDAHRPWAASSAGRAPRSQRGGREFEPPAVHQQFAQFCAWVTGLRGRMCPLCAHRKRVDRVELPIFGRMRVAFEHPGRAVPADRHDDVIVVALRDHPADGRVPEACAG